MIGAGGRRNGDKGNQYRGRGRRNGDIGNHDRGRGREGMETKETVMVNYGK